jgi:hypothetical protein
VGGKAWCGQQACGGDHSGISGRCRRTRLAPSGAELGASLPAEFSAWLKARRALLGKLITDANIKPG